LFLPFDPDPSHGGPVGRPASPGNLPTGPHGLIGYRYTIKESEVPFAPRSFPAGLSNVVLWAEKYAQCTNLIFQPANELSGGKYWAYCSIGPNDPSRLAGFAADKNVGFLPDTCPVYPVFGITLWDAPPSPLAANMISIGPASKPLFQPQPFDGLSSQCDPRVASTGHAVMSAGMADGSVRGVSSGVSGRTWWRAIVPSEAEVLPDEW
jgi:hypothetical protein